MQHYRSQTDHREDSQAGIHAAFDHPAQDRAQSPFLNIAHTPVNDIRNDAGIKQDRAGMSKDIDAPSRPSSSLPTQAGSQHGETQGHLHLAQEVINRFNQVDREGQYDQQPIGHQRQPERLALVFFRLRGRLSASGFIR